MYYLINFKKDFWFQSNAYNHTHSFLPGFPSIPYNVSILFIIKNFHFYFSVPILNS